MPSIRASAPHAANGPWVETQTVRVPSEFHCAVPFWGSM